MKKSNSNVPNLETLREKREQYELQNIWHENNNFQNPKSPKAAKSTIILQVIQLIIMVGSLVFAFYTLDLKKQVKDLTLQTDSLTEEKKSLMNEKYNLNSQNDKLSNQKFSLMDSIAQLKKEQKKLIFNPLTFHLNIIKRGGRYSDVSTEYFVNYLREKIKNPSFVKILEDSISTFKIVEQRALLFHILYASTKDIKYLDSLETSIELLLPISAFPPPDYFNLIDILGDQRYLTVNDKVKICSILIKYLEKVELGRYTKYFIYDVYRIVLEYDKVIWNMLDKNHKSLINLINQGRSILLSPGPIDNPTDLNQIFGEFMPIPFIVFVSEMMVNENDFAQPKTIFYQIINDFRVHHELICKNLDIPDNYDLNSWINWRKRASVLIKTWMGNLDALSTDEEIFNYYFYNYKLQ